MEFPGIRSGAGRYLARYPFRPACGWVATLLVIGLAQVPASSGEEVGVDSSIFFFHFSISLMFIATFPTIVNDHDTHFSPFPFTFLSLVVFQKTLLMIRYDHTLDGLHDYYIP